LHADEPYVIRGVDGGDAEEIAPLGLVAQEFHRVAAADRCKSADRADLLAVFAREIGSSDVVTLLAEAAGRVVGYVFAKVVARPETARTSHIRRCVLISSRCHRNIGPAEWQGRSCVRLRRSRERARSTRSLSFIGTSTTRLRTSFNLSATWARATECANGGRSRPRVQARGAKPTSVSPATKEGSACVPEV